MFRHVYHKFRESSMFEKLLLIVGVGIGVVGFNLINTLFIHEETLSWPFLMTLFLWLILIFIVILTDSNENIKEELSIIIREHIEETRLLREEVRLLRIGAKKNK